MNDNLCPTCGHLVKPTCKMCGKVIESWPANAPEFLKAAGWREDGDLWKVPTERLTEEEQVRGVDHIEYDVAGKAKSRTPQYILIHPAGDNPVGLEDAVRMELGFRNGPARSATITRKRYSSEECQRHVKAAEATRKYSGYSTEASRGLIKRAKEMEAMAEDIHYAQCCGCYQWPDATPDEIRAGKVVLAAV